MALLLLVFLPLSGLFMKIFNVIVKARNWEIDENLPNYFDAVDRDDKNFSVAEEDNMRKNYVLLYILINVIENKDID